MSAIAAACRMVVEMKKPTTSKRPAKRLTADQLAHVVGGGLSGPDQCDPRYRLRCIQDATPPGTQDC